MCTDWRSSFVSFAPGLNPDVSPKQLSRIEPRFVREFVANLQPASGAAFFWRF
jgi:hypothetical protein